MGRGFGRGCQGTDDEPQTARGRGRRGQAERSESDDQEDER